MTRPPFGSGSTADESGYSLDFLIGWLEDMIDHEADECSGKALLRDRRARLEQAENALGLLQEVSEWSPLLTREYAKRAKAKKQAWQAIAQAEGRASQ